MAGLLGLTPDDDNAAGEGPGTAGWDVGQRAVLVTAYIAQGFYLALGIVGLLFVESTLAEREGSELLGAYTIHTGGAIIYLAVGIVGPPMSTRPSWSRLYVIGLSVLFTVWGLLGLVLNGSPSDLFTGQALVVATHLLTGLAAGAVVLWADRASPVAPGDGAPG